ncbi:hypothetical protein P879_01419 [Paragonimus westermani]|uniref:Uncharacterized protein n=1 Tax=Paragonimus westermani TaxID=34504 RepID=A0A8T0DWV3_9TREM|nr:hypothetical protein P879_01419 [Paragonimus westermani]
MCVVSVFWDRECINGLPSLPEAQEPTTESSVLREYNTPEVQLVDEQPLKSPEKRPGKRVTRSREPQLNEAENVQLASDITKEPAHTPTKDTPTSHEPVPMPETISSPVVSEKENVCDALSTADFPQPESNEHVPESTTVASPTPVLSSIPRIPVCRYCERTQDSKMIRKACTSCNALILAFIRKLTRLDDCACLRDLPCPSRWALEWVPSADLVSRSKEKVLFQKYGPVLEDWCDPCKFTHYIRLGCRLSEYLWKTIPNYQILKSLNFDRLDDPVFQHRGRERHVEQYLRLLVEDFSSSRISIRSALENDESSNLLVHPFDSPFARFLDALWVRPLHLPSLAQLVSFESCPREGLIAEVHCSPTCSSECEHSAVKVIVEQSEHPTLNNGCTESAPPESSMVASSSQDVDSELKPNSSSFIPTLAELCYQSGAPRPVNLMSVPSSVHDRTSYDSQDNVSSTLRSHTPLSLAANAPDASDLTGLQHTSSPQVSHSSEDNCTASNFESLATLRYSPFTDIRSHSPDSSPLCPVGDHDAHVCKVEENLSSKTTPQPDTGMTESFHPTISPAASMDHEPGSTSELQGNVSLDAECQTTSNSSTFKTHGTTIEPVEPCSLCVFRCATCQRHATQTIRNDLARKLLRYSQYAITLGPVKVNSRSRLDSKYIPSALPDKLSDEELPTTDACKQVSTVDKPTLADHANSESCKARETVSPEQVVLTTASEADPPSSGLHEPKSPDPQDGVVMEALAADRNVSSPCHVDSTVVLPSEPVAENADVQTPSETNDRAASDATGSSDFVEVVRSSLNLGNCTEDAEVEALVDQTSVDNKSEPDTSIALPSTLTPPDVRHRSKIESQTQSLSICGPCLLQLRSTAGNVITVLSAQFTDCLAELMHQPNRFCSYPRPIGQIQQSCLESRDGKLCERCYLYKSLLHVFQTLGPESDSTGTGVSTENASSSRQGEFVLPVGGPLLLPPVSVDQTKPNSFYDCRIAPKWPIPEPNGPDSHSPSACLCCSTHCDLLSHYIVGSPNQQICSGCLWTYKAAMLSASIDPRVRRIASRLASAAAATDHALPLLSLASRRTLVDTARLACMLSNPCTAGCVTSAKLAEPAWFTCPACTIRRCHRLLQSTLPYHAPRWYRRRVKLLTKSKLLEDLDPRLMWLLLERTNTLSSPESSKNIHHRLSLVHVEYTTSVIERWLLPPELPASTAQEHETCDYSASSSEDESQVDDDVFSNDSSGFSTDSTPFTVSEQESEYGGEAWWDGQEFVDEPTRTTVVIEPEQDSSATEPETDPVRAEELTISFTTSKRNRKPSLKAAEAVADSVVRKSARSVTKSSLLKEETQVDTVCEPIEINSGMPDHSSDCTTTEVVQDIHKEVTTNGEDSVEPQAVCSVVAIQTPEKPDSPTESVQNEADTVTAAPRLAPRNQTNKRKSDQTEELIIRGKRRLKMNHRFLDDYDGNLPSLTGRDRRFRDDSGTSRDSNTSSISSRASGTSALSRKTSSCNRASLLAQKRAHARLNQRDRSVLMSVDSKLGRPSSKQHTHGSTSGEPKTHEVDKVTDGTSRSSGLGPRVKQISRPGLKPDETRFASTLSAMVQAARLAAVGAKIPGGTSPNHAALAATAHTTVTDGDDDEDDDLGSNASDAEPSSLHIRHDQSRPSVTGAGSARSLLDRCGQCPACCGVIQPCGRCTNCRLLRKFGKQYPDGNARPCRELICFRRRPIRTGSNSGPRVKLPSNFPSPGNTGLNTPSYTQKNHSGHSDLTATPTTISSSRRDAFSPNCRVGTTSMGGRNEGRDKHQSNDSNSVSLFHTIPGLAPQLEIDTWLGQSANNNHDPNVACVHPRDYFRSTKPMDNLNVRSDVAVTPIPGGDLGMRFCPTKQPDVLDTDQDRIRPIEGEVVTSELAHHGGYAVVTTMAAAPPKEICYACGSGGGQLLFCVSCAEPFHFYCVERQFRPRRKDHFICRNCTECRHCRQPAADLRCTRCSGGYHPACLLDYAPAQSSHRGNWVCPHCTSCIHCGAKPFTRLPDSSGSETPQSADVSSSLPRLTVSWSTESSKCAACNQAEARGDICPECERAYLPSTKQMIQCDTCHLWMHRTCTKLTADEYEWIARLPAGQLNKFVVNCTVCQSEQNQQALPATSNGTVGQDPINPSNDQLSSDAVGNGAGRLRTLARDTLMERMAGLVASCRRPVDPLEPTASSASPIEASPNGLLSSSKTPHIHSSSAFPTRKLPDKGDLSRNRRIPQVDGTFDDELKEDSMDRRRRRISADCPLYKPASDALFYEHADLSSPHSSSPSSNSLASGYPLAHPESNMKQASAWSSSYSCKSTGFKRVDLTDTERSTFIRSHEELHDNRSRYHSGSSTSQSSRIPQPLIAPPTTAAWVAENESEHIWTSPRSLIYRLLTRILHRLSAHPINSSYANALRRLLRWLMVATESYFPWLNISEMANDVRDVLRQANGEFGAVWRHFEKCSLIEIHELICPVVARLSDLHWRHSRPTNSSCSATWSWSSVCLANRCLHAIMQHLRAHHPSAINPPSRLPPRLSEAKYIIAAQTTLAHSQPSQCHRPHELEVMEKMRNEAREERWVEHWSSVEEEMVLHNFQRHLLREHRRCLMSTNSKLAIEQPSADAPSNASPAPTAGPMILDEAFKDVYAVIADDQQNDTHVSEPEASFSLALTGDELNMVFDPNDSSSKQATSVEDRSDRFYFALDEFWTAAMGKKSNNKPLLPVDLDGVKQPDVLGNCPTRTAEVEVAEEEEEDSTEEDVRCCLLCAYHGDNNIEGRLLFTGADTWVHVNCALWSNEVYEEETGQLIGLSDALRRSRVTACADCGRFGATMVCANAHEPICTLYTPPWSPSSETDDRDYSPTAEAFLQKAVHFACALRRRPPTPRSVFTADRSWFCSPECHQAATRQRLADAIHSLRTRKLYSRGKRMQKLINQDAMSALPEIPLSKDEYSMLENSVADDLEPISLGELLVCRRVFVPSDCFTASLYPLAFDYSLRKLRASPDTVPGVLEAARQAIKNLAASPNSLAFVRCSGLIAANLVVTVGSLRVDRLGEVREASDALTTSRTPSTTDLSTQSRRCNYLCPINYRARRIYWSCYKLDDRVSYTLHVKQTHAVANPITATLNDSVALHKLDVSRPTILSASNSNMCVSVTDINPVTWRSSPTSATSVSVSVESAVSAPPLTTSTNTVPVVAPVQQNNQPDCHVSSSPSDILKPAQQKSPVMSSSPPQNSVIRPPGVVTANGIPLVIHKLVSSGSETNITGAKNIVVNSAVHSSSPRILNTISLSNPGDPRPGGTTTCRLQTLPRQPSCSSPSQTSIRCTSIVPAVSCPTEVRRVNPVFFHTRSGDTPKSAVYAVVTVAKEVTQPARTCYPISLGSMRHFTVSTTNSNAIPIVSRPGGTYRIPLQLTPLTVRNPTTPTKDAQLADQLTGLFKNLPPVRSQPVQPNLANRAIQLIRETSTPAASRITVPQPWLPQLDGTLDPDAEEDWYPEPKRSRSLARDLHTVQRQRSGSLTSNDSSVSATSVVSRNKMKRREVGLQQKRLCKQSSLLALPRRPLSAKRRWIEERNKQQELAHLVSKAKLANHARLYQHEVEKHARSFRLRFAIDGVVRTAPNPLCAWRTITGRVAALREKKGLPRLINESIDGWTQFGLNHRHVIFLVEQMRGAFQCYRYRFRYHWRKVDELRRKFTPPVPVAEGCARAIMCTKPRLPANHARDPLSFLSCKANPPPRALLKPGQGVPLRKQNSNPTNLVSPPEPASLLSPNEQKACAEAARQAASLVAVQLKLPVRVREAYIAQAVTQVTGLPIKSPENMNARSRPGKTRSQPQDRLTIDDEKGGDGAEGDDDSASTGNNSSSDEGDDGQETDLGTVTTQFKHMVSGPMARFLRVSVHPSRIHGRGLFALRGFREDEMVIEYMGELIRNLICEIREVRYRAAGVDCYMFRIDQDLVIDATYAGNAARFINHSCDPNCYAKVITLDDKKHIVILAQRRIYPGEELTYDYRFPKESDKLLCNCGSHNCRRYLN